MIIEIHSTNPDLSSILGKNINTFNGTQLRTHKNGVIIGRFISPNEYHIIFHDTKYSYTNFESNQLDFQSFCNPRVFLGIATENLRHLLQDRSSYENIELSWLNSIMKDVDIPEEYSTRVIIRGIYIESYILKYGFILQKYMKNDLIEIVSKHKNIYDIIIESDTVFDAVNLAVFTAMYIAAKSKEPWYINKDIAMKYIRIMGNLNDVPYFVIHSFAKSVLQSQELFNYAAPELEKLHPDLKLSYGGTQLQRINAVKQYIISDKKIQQPNVLELGCGEMDYAYSMFKNLTPGGNWYASDKVDYSHLLSSIRKRNSNAKIHFTSDLLNVDKTPDSILLAIEVIEHMPLEASLDLLRDIINHHMPQKIIITTPCASFNKNFGLTGFRHDDHYFELTEDQFDKYITRLSGNINPKYSTRYYGIGDRVNGEYMSQSVVMEKANEA